MKEYVLKAAQMGFAAGAVFNLDAPGADAGAADYRAVDENKGERALDHPAAGRTEEELRRFDESVRTLKQELTEAAQTADEKNAAIFEAEQVLLEDEEYAGAIRKRIREEGQEAAWAVQKTGDDVAKKFAASESSYIRGRVDDVKGITQRLLGILGGVESRRLTAPAILVAEELSPLQISGLDASLLLGLITVRGTPSSHVSVMAGNLGIPYVYGSPDAAEAARTCSRLIIDGEKLILDPEEEMYQQARLRMEETGKHGEDAAAESSDRRTRVYANIAGPEDIEAMLASGAEGVGLMRSEFLFLGRESAPSEEEQFEAYRSVAEAMGEKETVIRTMDLGSDKRPVWLPLPDEKNPALGWRGLRISLKERELFKTQLRALLRAAAYGNVKVMVPMVTSVREIEVVEACMKECAEELTRAGISFRVPPLGAMVETPAAALIAQELARKVAFFSIGTNDLTQYTLALDREAEGLEAYDDPCHEAVLRLIRMTAQAGAENHIPTSVCGELVGRETAVRSLIEAGVDKLSVSVPKVKATKRCAAEAEKALAKKAEDDPDRIPSEQVRCEQDKCEPDREQGRPTKKVEIAAPADGKMVPREEIPDPAFAFGSMWQCVGIMPDNGRIYAPCDGVVSGIAVTKHAMTFTAADGREILVHVGIDTVRLDGRGFTVLVKEGESVSKGEQVMEADLDVIRAAGLSPIVIAACVT